MFVWRKGLSRVPSNEPVHHVNIDITLFRVSKCARQSADNIEPAAAKDGLQIRWSNDEIELHCQETEAARFT